MRNWRERSVDIEDKLMQLYCGTMNTYFQSQCSRMSQLISTFYTEETKPNEKRRLIAKTFVP